MKKKLSVLIIMLVMAFGVMAQGGFYISPFAGVNGSGIVIKDDVFKMQGYTGMKAGLNAGLKFQYEFTTPFLVELQAYYNRNGYSMTIPETDMMEHIDFYLDCISIPLMIGGNIYVGEKEKFSISPKIGIVPNIFVNTFAKYQGESYKTKVDNKVYWTCMLDIELAYKLNNFMSIFFNINGRAGWKLITYPNITEIVKDWAAPGVYNYVFSGNVGLKFQLTNREKEIYEFY